MEITEGLLKRFWGNVDKRGQDDCWEWNGTKMGAGYGSVYVGVVLGNKINTGAHRVSWTIHNGPIPDRMHVLHRCDNPSCVNPAHLWLGTHQENVKDMMEKGRGRGYFTPQNTSGVHNAKAKLTPEQVIEIRHKASQGRSYPGLAREYGVTNTMIGYIVRRDNWKHIEEIAP